MEQKPKSKKKLYIIIAVVLSLAFIGNLLPKKQEQQLEKEGVQIAAPVDDKQAAFEKQLNGWDGSHRNLVKHIKANMQNPKSFEHVDTKCWTNNPDYNVVKMTYRGTNAFNAVVTQMVRAEIDKDGNILKVDEQ